MARVIGEIGFGRQEYGVTGRKVDKSRAFEAAIGVQSSYLPSLYAAKESRKQAKATIDLEREKMDAQIKSAENELAAIKDLSSAEIASNESIAQRKLDLEREIAEAKEKLDREMMAESESQATVGNVIGGASTVISGYNAYDKIFGKEPTPTDTPTPGGGQNVYQSIFADTSASDAAASGMTAGESELAGIGAEPGMVGEAGMGVGSGLYTGGMTAGEMELAGIGALGEGAATTGAGVGLAEGASVAWPTTLSGWAGPIAVVAFPVLGALGSMSSRRRTQHAREDWLNSEEGKLFSDEMDRQRLGFTQSVLGSMTPEQRESAVKSELDKFYPLGEVGIKPEGNLIIGAGGAQQNAPNVVDPIQALQQHGTLVMPQDEYDKYTGMIAKRRGEYERLTSERQGMIAYGAE